jgi:hypothetical protein
MMKKCSLTISFIILTLVLFSLLSSFVSAQYQTQETAEITISSSGTTHIDQSQTTGGITIDIAGTPGATGSVSTATYTANPQPTASIPNNVELTHFVVVTFNVDPNQFQSANITISFTDAEVSGISPPYVLYKYSPLIDSYIQLTSVTDLSTKTITVTVIDPTDPLFAIGGSTVEAPPPEGVSIWVWSAVAAVVVVVVIVVAVLVFRTRYNIEIKFGK